MSRPLVTAVLLVGALLLAPVAAEAKPKPPVTASVKDRAGDAPARVDLLSARYSLSAKRSTFEVKVKELSDDTFLAFEVWPLNDAWDRLAVYRENGRTVAKVYFVDNEEETRPFLRRCPGLRVGWNARTDTVTASWPRSCMQASLPGFGPYEFRVFSRVGGQKDPARDTMPIKKLKF